MRAMLIILVVVAIGAATTAWAAIPNADGTISSCYAKKGGKVRVVKAGAKCKKGERALAWSQTGPKGPAGPAGVPGPKGPAGPKGDPGGPGRVYTAFGAEILTGANYTEVAALELPAGSYLLIGTGQIHNQQQAAETVSCNVYDSTGEFLGAATTSVPSGEYADLAAQRAISLPAARRVHVECIDGDGTDGVLATITLTALPAGTIVDQS